MAAEDSSSLPHLAFVYGTLKRGEPQAKVMEDVEKMGRASFVSGGRTVRKFPFVVGSSYNVPFLLDAPGQGNRARGDIFRCDDRMMASLDRFERVPDFYHRRAEQVEADNGEVLECSLYVLPKFKPELLQERMLENWTMEDKSLKRFVERHERKLDIQKVIDEVRDRE